MEIKVGEPEAKQIEALIGFDTGQEKPLEFIALFNWADGHWTHVATLACRCEMSESEEPFNLYPWKPHPPGEWAVTLWSHTRDYIDSSGREIRFRLRDGLLWPLIDFESHSNHCPDGVLPNAKCLMSSSSLEKAKLVSETGEPIPGFVVLTYSGMVSNNDVKVPILGGARCAPYMWSDIHFSYDPSPLRPERCGLPASPPAQRNRSHPIPKPANPAFK